MSGMVAGENPARTVPPFCETPLLQGIDLTMAKVSNVADKSTTSTESDLASETTVEATSTDSTDATAAVAQTAPVVVETVPTETQVAPLTNDPGTHDHFAIRDFKARFDHQVLSFLKDELIDGRVGHALRALGAPIKIVEKTAEESKGAA